MFSPCSQKPLLWIEWQGTTKTWESGICSQAVRLVLGNAIFYCLQSRYDKLRRQAIHTPRKLLIPAGEQ